MVERSQGPKSEIFSRKCDLANCLHDRCAFAEAEALVRDAVSMKRSLFAGLDDAHYLQWQADFLRDQGRHEEAAHLDHEALAMVRNRTVRGFPADWDGLTTCAVALATAGEWPETEKFRRAQLDLARKAGRGRTSMFSPRLAIWLRS